MKILFLTNNPQISDTLYEWLTAQEDKVIYQSEPINADYIRENNIDFIVSYNYIHIIKKDVIDLLPHSIINLHISYLPYNRGIAPNIWSFIDGTPSGVTIHEIDEGLDTGDILLREQIIFDPDTETLRSSYNKLHELIQNLFRDNWHLLKLHKLTPKNAGGGTLHNRKDSALFEPILNYEDKVSVFLKKLRVFKTDI